METIRHQQKILSDKVVNKIVEKLKSEINETTQGDWQTFDFNAEMDRTLTVKENFQSLRGKLIQIGLIKPAITKEQYEAQKEAMLREWEEDVKKTVEKYNSEIVCDNKELKDYYYGLDRRIELLCKNDFNILIIKGNCGVGKSYRVNSKLNEMKTPYVITQGKITPAMLYRKLYEANREGRVAVFRDTANLLQNDGVLDMLKAHAETVGSRMVCNLTYGKQQLDIPPAFVAEYPIIFEVNRLNYGHLTSDVQAVIDRGNFYEIVIPRDSMKNIMRILAKDGEEWKVEVTEYLINKAENNAGNSLNLREQQQAFRIFQASERDSKNWKLEIDVLIEDSKTQGEKLLYEFAGMKAVKKADFIKFVARKMDITIRRTQMIVKDWIEKNDIFNLGADVCVVEVK